MSLKRSLACGVLVGAALTAAKPVLAQTASVTRQMGQLQEQIQQLEQQLQNLQVQVQQSQGAAQRAQAEAHAARSVAAKAAAAAPPPDAPHVIFSANNRPGWASADGRNSIELTGRLNLDLGDYFDYRPNSKYTSPQDLNSDVNARRARIGVLGKFDQDWNYALIYDFGGSSDGLGTNVSGAPASGIENAFISYNGFHPLAFDLGYLDTPYTLDEATSSNDIMFMERSSSQVVATSIAGGDNRSAFGARLALPRYWAGVYMTGPTSGASHVSGEPLGATGRFTVQALQTPDYSLHLGVDAEGLFKAAGAPETLTLSDRPELRIDPTSILSTGALGTAANPVTGASVFSAEAAAGYHNLFAQAEYYHYDVDRQGLASADFNGGYVEGSWTITGEHRQYIPTTGAYSGITPFHNFSLTGGHWGAFELAARYSVIDLNSNFISGLTATSAGTSAVAGGMQTVWTLGLNWYVNRNIRFMLDYLHGDVNKENGVASVAALGTPIGANFDAIALRTQVAF